MLYSVRKRFSCAKCRIQHFQAWHKQKITISLFFHPHPHPHPTGFLQWQHWIAGVITLIQKEKNYNKWLKSTPSLCLKFASITFWWRRLPQWTHLQQDWIFEPTLSCSQTAVCYCYTFWNFVIRVLKCHMKTFQISYSTAHLWGQDDFLCTTSCFLLSVITPFILLILLVPTFIVMTSYITAIHFSRATIWKSIRIHRLLQMMMMWCWWKYSVFIFFFCKD